MKNKETGKMGEDIAANYLLNKKYLILSRNYKINSQEIDIVAKRDDGAIIFCEVKTILLSRDYRDIGTDSFMPEDHINAKKMKNMIYGANLFIARNPEVLSLNVGWEIDLIAITINKGESIILKHYKNLP